MEGITGILVFIGIGSFLGIIVGSLLWHKDHKRIKLQEQLIDHYKALSEYLDDKLNEKWGKQHAIMMQNLDDTFKELEKAANEWEPKRLMATLSYNDTNMGMAPGLSATINADETCESGITYLLQFGDYENPAFTREEMQALHGKEVMVVNPDTRRTLYTLKELRDITKSWGVVNQREAFERNQSLFVFYPGGRAVEKSTTLAKDITDKEFVLEKRFDTVKFESRIEMGAPVLYITGDKPRMEEDVITDDLTEGQEVWLPTLAGYIKGTIDMDAYGEPYAEEQGYLFHIGRNERNEWISTGMANLKGIAKLKLGPLEEEGR